MGLTHRNCYKTTNPKLQNPNKFQKTEFIQTQKEIIRIRVVPDAELGMQVGLRDEPDYAAINALVLELVSKLCDRLMVSACEIKGNDPGTESNTKNVIPALKMSFPRKRESRKELFNIILI